MLHYNSYLTRPQAKEVVTFYYSQFNSWIANSIIKRMDKGTMDAYRYLLPDMIKHWNEWHC